MNPILNRTLPLVTVTANEYGAAGAVDYKTEFEMSEGCSL